MGHREERAVQASCPMQPIPEGSTPYTLWPQAAGPTASHYHRISPAESPCMGHRIGHSEAKATLGLFKQRSKTRNWVLGSDLQRVASAGREMASTRRMEVRRMPEQLPDAASCASGHSGSGERRPFPWDAAARTPFTPLG